MTKAAEKGFTDWSSGLLTQFGGSAQGVESELLAALSQKQQDITALATCLTNASRCPMVAPSDGCKASFTRPSTILS